MAYLVTFIIREYRRSYQKTFRVNKYSNEYEANEKVRKHILESNKDITSAEVLKTEQIKPSSASIDDIFGGVFGDIFKNNRK